MDQAISQGLANIRLSAESSDADKSTLTSSINDTNPTEVSLDRTSIPTIQFPDVDHENANNSDLAAGMPDEEVEIESIALVDLDLLGNIRWASSSWIDVIGRSAEDSLGKNIAEFVIEEDKQVFSLGIESLRQNENRSQIIKFFASLGPRSKLNRKRSTTSELHIDSAKPEDHGKSGTDISNLLCEPQVELEAQGIMVYNRAAESDNHSMWMIRPAPRQKSVLDLPELAIKSLGVGAEMLAQYLNQIVASAHGSETIEPHSPVICRICERHIPPWWFEKHTGLCALEHKAESQVQMAHEELVEHRSLIVELLATLKGHTETILPESNTGDSLKQNNELTQLTGDMKFPEYQGYRINICSKMRDTMISRRTDTLETKDNINKDYIGTGVSADKVMEGLLDLCDTALEINTPIVKEDVEEWDGEEHVYEVRCQSPNSEERILQVMEWQCWGDCCGIDDRGLVLLSEDSGKLAKAKVEAVIRLRRILEYSERVRMEYVAIVEESIENAMARAARIRGELMSGDDSEVEDHGSQVGRSSQLEYYGSEFSEGTAGGGGCGGSLIGGGSGGSKRFGVQSVCGWGGVFDSDIGGESDTSMRSSLFSGRRAESPCSEVSSRLASSHGWKRSIIVGSISTNGGNSSGAVVGGRIMGNQPGSPLKVTKHRGSGVEWWGSTPLPTSVSNSEHSGSGQASPIVHGQHLWSGGPYEHHRRESSVNWSDVGGTNNGGRTPVSPRLVPLIANGQGRSNSPSIRDFAIIKPISKGAFGSVYLSKKKSTGDYYAIKVLKKADMIAKNQVRNVKTERAVMIWQGESEFVAKLFWTFSSKDYLFLVMEYMNGGDLATLVKALGGLPEDGTMKYMAEIVLCVSDLHGRGIVHRDLKPENLLIDQHGHLKLTDFGLSRMGMIGRQKRALSRKCDEPMPDLLGPGGWRYKLPDELNSGGGNSCGGGGGWNMPWVGVSGNGESWNNACVGGGEDERVATEFGGLSGFTSEDDEQRMGEKNYALFKPEEGGRFVGTPDYLAPETIKGVGQDEMSDWWSMGCIMFEMICGYPPFHGDTPEIVFENILERRIDWSKVGGISECGIDLMKGLLSHDVKERLGSQNGGKEIMEHGWFEGLNWSEVRKAEPFFVPAPENAEDTEYFDLRGAQIQDFKGQFDEGCGKNEDNIGEKLGDAGRGYGTGADESILSGGSGDGDNMDNKGHDCEGCDGGGEVRSVIKYPGVAGNNVERNRRLSEPVGKDDFGNFSYKNLGVLKKANLQVIEKLRAQTEQQKSGGEGRSETPSPASPKVIVGEDELCVPVNSIRQSSMPICLGWGRTRSQTTSLYDEWSEVGSSMGCGGGSLGEERFRVAMKLELDKIRDLGGGDSWVLICEENWVSRWILEQNIAKMGYKSVTVRSGSEAVERVMGGRKFKAILIEYSLGEGNMNGQDIGRLIRETKNINSRTNLIMVTGYFKGEKAPEPFDYLIKKPPTLKKLEQAFKRIKRNE